MGIAAGYFLGSEGGGFLASRRCLPGLFPYIFWKATQKYACELNPVRSAISPIVWPV